MGGTMQKSLWQMFVHQIEFDERARLSAGMNGIKQNDFIVTCPLCHQGSRLAIVSDDVIVWIILLFEPC